MPSRRLGVVQACLQVPLVRRVRAHGPVQEHEEAAMEILKLIPREVFLSMAGTLSSFKIYDLYYAIPPKDRHSGTSSD